MDSKSLEKKLSAVRESSEDIQAVSRWCIQHRSHHHSIVQAWSKAVKKAKVGHRLTLFYVCNDVVQNAKRKKCAELVQFFGTAIKEVAPLVREDKIRRKIVRIFNIWEERGIYDSKLVTEFVNIVEKVGTVNSTENEIVISSFQLTQLVESVRNLIALERTSQNLLADLKTQEHMLTEEEIRKLRLTVKERGASREGLEEFEESVSSLEFYINSLQCEIDERTKAVTLLEQAEIFYETQRGEAKLVATAYKNFNIQVKFLKRRLLEKVPNLPDEISPVPTPPSDAPSPQSDTDEIDTEASHQNSEELTSFLNSNTMTSAESSIQKDKESLYSNGTSPVSHDNSFTEINNSDVVKSPNFMQSSSKERTLEEEQQDFEMQIANFSNTKKSYMDAKPMNAKELLDTFGKSSTTMPVVQPPFQIPASVLPIPPLPPDPPMNPSPLSGNSLMSPIRSPNFHTQHSSLPIPLPPCAPPPVPLNIPMPMAFPPPLPPQPVHIRFPPPLPKLAPYQAFSTDNTGGVRGPWSDTWMPLPPPPPPPPPMDVKESKISIGPRWTEDRPQFTENHGWNSYENNTDEPPEDDDCDDRNWGEPPGTEELQTFDQIQAAVDEGKSPFLIPPPPPPPQFSSLPSRDDEIESPKIHSNLVNIEPQGERAQDSMNYHCYDYRSLSEEDSFLNDGLFNSDDTDMRVREPVRRRNGEGSGSDMDISEGETSDYDRPKRHKKDSDRNSKEQNESSHKPVSFSLAKGSKPLVPLSGGFNQEDDDSFRKKSLPMPPSYIRRKKLQERNSENETNCDTGCNIPVLSQPLLDNLNTNFIAKALDNVREKENEIEKEQPKGPSISEALGMYYDSDNDSDTMPQMESVLEEKHNLNEKNENDCNEEQSNSHETIKDSSHEAMEESSQEAIEDSSHETIEDSSHETIEDSSHETMEDSSQVETTEQSHMDECSQVIESFISETRASESVKEIFTENTDECIAAAEQEFVDDTTLPIGGQDKAHNVESDISEHSQPITAMYSSAHIAPPYQRAAAPWRGHRGQGNFYAGRPPRARGFSPRPPFNRGSGAFRGHFNVPMGPRWRTRGNPWW